MATEVDQPCVWFRRAVADRVQTDTRISGSPGPARSSPVPVLGSPVPASSCQVSTEGRPQDRSWVHMGRVPRAVGPVQKTNPDVDREWPPGVSRAKLSWHGRASCSRCCRAGVCRGNRPGRAGAPDTVPDTVQIRSRYGSDTVQIRSRYGSDTVPGPDTAQIRFRYGSDTVQIRSRYGSDPGHPGQIADQDRGRDLGHGCPGTPAVGTGTGSGCPEIGPPGKLPGPIRGASGIGPGCPGTCPADAWNRTQRHRDRPRGTRDPHPANAKDKAPLFELYRWASNWATGPSPAQAKPTLRESRLADL